MVSHVLSAKYFGSWEFPIWKHVDDLRRYEIIFDQTKPDLLIECGTNNGSFANFVQSTFGIQVLTIDIDSNRLKYPNANIKYIVGSSVDPEVVNQVEEYVKGYKRVMVSLDSDHSEDHVAKEIELYHKFVSLGCYFVIEDGIIKTVEHLQPQIWEDHGCHEYNFDVVPAIKKSQYLSDFNLDVKLENLTEITMNPYGWLYRNFAIVEAKQ